MKKQRWEDPVEQPKEEVFCWLCERTMGDDVQWHHPIPKSKGGKAKVPAHPICQKTIHANFTNAELSRMGDDRDAIMAREEMVKFVAWVKGKPPEFNAPIKGKK
ncbi:MAG: hypothetical protein RLZZ08_1816 [Pseudomonadota bacterium]|jgi:hypothetical protein